MIAPPWRARAQRFAAVRQKCRWSPTGCHPAVSETSASLPTRVAMVAIRDNSTTGSSYDADRASNVRAGIVRVRVGTTDHGRAVRGGQGSHRAACRDAVGRGPDRPVDARCEPGQMAPRAYVVVLRGVPAR